VKEEKKKKMKQTQSSTEGSSNKLPSDGNFNQEPLIFVEIEYRILIY
jgi:hypothetical protein